MKRTQKQTIVVGARKSPLSQVQIEEVYEELRQYYMHVEFQRVLVEAYGDRDQETSLRTLGKTDFFTREIDELLLEGKCDVGIHSAKDLPEPLPKGLRLVALTVGLDAADVLVMREGERLFSGAVIATSSERREEAVKSLGVEVSFRDLRGTIGQRLAKLNNGEADGVVLAEAALIRLGLTHLNRIRLPGDSVPLQGKLAVVAREDDLEMRELFECLDSRIKL